MDKHIGEIAEKRISRTVEALNKNKFDAYYIKDTNELIEKLKEIMPKGASCSVGGSMTLFETGVIDFLKSGGYDYLDRYAENADVGKVYHDALSCDFYVTSSNAITENGELYNMDGNGNRVAAMVYGPKKVIVISGANKIVRDIESARNRNKEIAAPANAIRVGKSSPCAKTGVCADCKGTERICCHELISHYQRNEKRIIVLILPDSYGY